MSILLSRRAPDGAVPAPSGQGATAHRRLLPALAALAVAGLLTAAAVAPMRPWASAAAAPVAWPGAVGAPDAQTLEVVRSATAPVVTGGFSAQPAPPPAWATAPIVGIPDPGTAQAIGYEMVKAIGWDDNEFRCLVALWDRESHWNALSGNAESGAYGIPQALPGEKMAAAGADWQTNPATQITWGLSYISSRYGTPCGAWEHSEAVGWY